MDMYLLKSFTTNCCILTHLRYIAMENIVRKRPVCLFQAMFPFLTMFSSLYGTYFSFQCTLKCRLSYFDALKIYSYRKPCEKKAKLQCFLFSHCFLSYMALIFHFKCTLKCRLQFVSD